MKTKRDKGILILIICLLAVALYSGVKIGTYFYGAYMNEKLNEELRAEFRRPERLPENDFAEPDPEQERMEKFERLRDINTDVVGWVNVPGTEVDYPVVLTGNNDYYLNRNFKKEWNVRGSIFMDYRNSAEEDLHTVIYGHNMKDGSMFGSLAKFKDRAFHEENSFIEYETPEEASLWQVFSVYLYRPEDDHFQVVFDSEEAYAQYLKEAAERSLYDTGVSVTAEDRMLTLMTCTYEFNDGRLVIHAKKVYDE